MVYISTFLNYVCFFVTTFGITYYLYNYFLKYYNKNIVNVVFWNILCEALGSNQFMTDGGDDINTNWDIRKEKICNKIADQIINGSIVTCVEVDNYPWMMNYFKTNFPYRCHKIKHPSISLNPPVMLTMGAL